jgi:hypothetical protein
LRDTSAGRSGRLPTGAGSTGIKRGDRVMWWLVTLALALMIWGYCLFVLDPAMLP